MKSINEKAAGLPNLINLHTQNPLTLKTYLSIALGLILFLQGAKVEAQCPSVDFSLPASVCLSESIYIDNNTTSAASYEWDFCSGDLSLDPTPHVSATSSYLFRARTFRAINVNGSWYGFAIDQPDNYLIRLEFGSSLENSPTVFAVGNPGTSFQNPTDLTFWKEGSNWYALVANTNENSVLLLNFGINIKSTPTVTNLGSLSGAIKGPVGVAVVKDSNGVFAFVTNSSAAEVVRLDFGATISNSPTATVIPVAGSNPRGIDIIRECGHWYGIITSYSNNQLFYLDFVNGLTVSPQVGALSIPGAAYSYPASVKLANEGGNFYAFVQSAYPANVYRINFGSSIVDGTGVYYNIGNLGISTDNGPLDLVNDQSKWYAFSINLTGNNSPGAGQLMRLDFPNTCGATMETYVGAFPPAFTYSSAGNYLITQKATNGEFLNYLAKSVNVVNSAAPDITFTSQNLCAGSNVNFSSANSSSNISAYQWDFGDGGSSSSANPSYAYLSAAVYYPSLTVTASNGCTNSFKDTLQIFNPPQANFNLPSASPLCTNQNYIYTNTSTSDPGSNPTWQWSVNGSNAAATQDLNYLFTSSAPQSVALTASIAGCSTQSTQSITTLVDGPLISFTAPANGCQGSSIPFTNTTTDQVAGFSWVFGDGNSSSQNSPSNTFSSSGNYIVSLSGTNALGCQNSFSKNITIYSVPQPNFVIEAPPLSCEKSPSQFDNLTPALVDSNINSWVWSFGDANNGSSSSKNPTYVFASASTYNVSLQATTNFGCTNSIQKAITIYPSPQANFSNSPACVNQSTHFTDASSGSISSYQWTIQSSVLSGTAPSYIFKSSGNFPVTLTVAGSNGCLNQITKNIFVPVMPVVDFHIESPCTGHPTTFQEVNSGGADPAVSWNWNFGLNSGIGSPTGYQFPAEGGYTVTMSTTRQSGCVYSTSKNIAISTGPIASFTPSVYAGAAPLDITFNNTSTADSYFWQFNDANQNTSTSTSPEFVFTELGKYKVLLTAYNTLGCSDTLSSEIDVVIPHIDIVMNDFSLTNDPISNSSSAVVTILNSGNIPLVDPEVLIGFGGDAAVKQKVSGIIRPGKSLVQTLGLQIVPRSLQYICAEINIADDVNVFNNKQCISLSDEEIVLDPYPNPSSSGSITLEWISAKQENVTITIFKSNGEVAFQQELSEFQSGLGQMTINTNSFNSGIYLVQFSGGGISKTFRIVISN